MKSLSSLVPSWAEVIWRFACVQDVCPVWYPLILATLSAYVIELLVDVDVNVYAVVVSAVEPAVNGNKNSFLFHWVWPTAWTSPELSTSTEWTVNPSILFAVDWFVVWFLILPS